MSMRTVWKFGLPVEDLVRIAMPRGAEVLHVDVQLGEPQIWMLVDPSEAPEPRFFRIAGTGHLLDRGDAPVGRHVGSFKMLNDTLIFHVFEAGSAPE